MTKIVMKEEYDYEGEKLDFDKMHGNWYLIKYIYNRNTYVATTKFIGSEKKLVWFDLEKSLSFCDFTDVVKQNYKIISEVSEIIFKYK